MVHMNIDHTSVPAPSIEDDIDRYLATGRMITVGDLHRYLVRIGAKDLSLKMTKDIVADMDTVERRSGGWIKARHPGNNVSRQTSDPATGDRVR